MARKSIRSVAQQSPSNVRLENIINGGKPNVLVTFLFYFINAFWKTQLFTLTLFSFLHERLLRWRMDVEKKKKKKTKNTFSPYSIFRRSRRRRRKKRGGERI